MSKEALTEAEWRSGVRNDGTRVTQSGAEPAMRYPLAPYPIPETHVDPAKTDGDVNALSTMITRIQAEVGALGAEALRVRDAALKQVDNLKSLAQYDGKEATMRAHAAAYDDLQKLIDDELVSKRNWTITSARDAVFKLYNDNVDLEREKNNAMREVARLGAESDVLRAENDALKERLARFESLASGPPTRLKEP